MLEDYKHLERAYNIVKDDLEDTIAENQSNHDVIANMSETLEKYTKSAVDNKSDLTEAVEVAKLDRYEAKLKTPESELSGKVSETFNLETSYKEFETNVEEEFEIQMQTFQDETYAECE